MRASSRVHSRPLPSASTQDAWKALATEIRASPSPYESPGLGRLYELALFEGECVLDAYREVDCDRRDDLVVDLLLASLRQLLAADRPRALFRVALHNRARSWLRRGDAPVERDEGPVTVIDRAGVEDAMIFRIDAHRALAQLPARDHAILFSVGLGEDREAVARAHGTTVANVDQIVSRARRRLGASHPRSLAA